MYRIVYRKIHKYLIKFIKNYKYTYIKGIFIINFEYIQLMINLFITYVIIVMLNLINYVLALFHDKFTCNTALRNPVFKWESCKGSV